MQSRTIAQGMIVGPQLNPLEVATLKASGVVAIICTRPDGEDPGQPPFAAIEDAARREGMVAHYFPIIPGPVSAEQGAAYASLLADVQAPIFAYCRTGMRAEAAYQAAQSHQGANGQPVNPAKTTARTGNGRDQQYTVVIVGGGAAGIATASSLLARDRSLKIAIIDSAEEHYYQPGWTLVGAGVFELSRTIHTMQSVIPEGVVWIKAAVSTFEPDEHRVVLDSGAAVQYDRLVVCPGLKLDWDGIAGLRETLGRNGVTSNYHRNLASYTWELVQGLRRGRAIFTQPPMPIKCAGAPQKAMYLSADHWRREGVLAQVSIDFCNAGAVLFGVPEYVPPLMEYVKRYNINLNFGQNLVAVDGARRVATFKQQNQDGTVHMIEKEFDMLHVVPPQTAPDFVRNSPLADVSGWIDVDPGTLKHKRFDDIFALGDVASTTNAKTVAAARKQAPVVAHNLLASLRKTKATAIYDGYGSCPLTVERGKIVLAEFTYGGKLAPSFPSWFINTTKPSRLAWLLKTQVLPPLYWKGMLKGRELMATPAIQGDH